MSAFSLAIKENGFAVVNDQTYAIYCRPEIDNYNNNIDNYCENGIAYKAIGFLDDGSADFDPALDNHVILKWDCTAWFNENRDDEFDCDWESDAVID